VGWGPAGGRGGDRRGSRHGSTLLVVLQLAAGQLRARALRCMQQHQRKQHEHHQRQAQRKQQQSLQLLQARPWSSSSCASLLFPPAALRLPPPLMTGCRCRPGLLLGRRSSTPTAAHHAVPCAVEQLSI
jgi:hypothetical protein